MDRHPPAPAAGPYVDIMEHKDDMNQRERRDVGIVAALEDSGDGVARQEPVRVIFQSLVKILSELVQPQHR